MGVSLLLMALPLTSLSCTKRTSAVLSTAKPPATPQLFEMGRQLYGKQCAICHGATGAGDGAAAYLLSPKPRDFTQNEFRLVSTNSMQATDDDLFLTITRGMPGSAMPSWESLTPEQRWALVYYVRALTQHPHARAEGALTQEDIDPDSIIRVPDETPKTPDSIGRGMALFSQACASCHGLQGKGDGQQLMADNAGFPIKPRDLTRGAFKGSSSSQDLYYRIIAGLPGSPMPSYAGVYTDEQIWDLVHFVQSLVPPGVEERVRMRARVIPVHRVRGGLPVQPTETAWRAVKPTYVAVTPLWWRDQRIEGVDVRALHNRKDAALHLSWDDPTQDDSLLTPQAFSDGVAVQFSTESDPPFFGMGDAGGAVTIWHWKAAWQEDMQAQRDIEHAYPNATVDWYPGQRDYRHGDSFEVSQAQTVSQDPQFMAGWGAENPLSNPHRTSAAEEAMAKGLGTLTSRPAALQRVHAKGVWQGGRWQVVLQRPLTPNEEDGFTLKPGQAVSVAFAVWDGHAADRNGQKSVSIWNTLKLER